MKRIIITVSFILFSFLSSCVENPFFGKNDTPKLKLEIIGNVKLQNDNDHSIIFVWIEGLNKSTKPDSNGNFKLKLDNPESLSGGAKAWNGVFKIYYYVANYQYEISEVLIKDGEFIFDKYDISKTGTVRQNILLKKIVRIETSLEPEKVFYDISNNIPSPEQTKVTIKIERTTSTPVTFTSYLGNSGVSSFFLKRVDTLATVSYIKFDKKADFTTNEELSSSMVSEIEISLWGIEPGVYEAIPFIIIHQQELPQELLKGISEFANTFTDQFFKVPLTINASRLSVLKR